MTPPGSDAHWKRVAAEASKGLPRPHSDARCVICKRPTRPERLMEVQPNSHVSGYCWRKEPDPWHARQCDAIAASRKPGSDAREVPCTCGSTDDVHKIECAKNAWLLEPPTPYAGPPPMPEGWIAVRADLAQRILAALELTARFVDANALALAAELRAVIGK